MSGPASRTLLYGGYGVHMDALDLIESCAPTHVAVGVNAVLTANHHHVWQLRGDIERDGDRYADQLRRRGSAVCVHAWLAGDERFVVEAARSCARLALKWGAAAVVPNPELPFWGTTDERLLAKKPQEREALVRAAQADKVKLCRRFIEVLREEGWRGAVWPAVFYWVPAPVREMVRLSTGLIAQMQSFSNPNKPGHGLEIMKPGVRQRDAWRKLAPWRRPEDPSWIMFGQQALYHQAGFGGDELESVRLACDTYLDGAQALSEAGLAFWELLWLRRHRWAQQALKMYSPRVNEHSERWRP
ncbi:MAG: hypothetical protein CMH57_02795 [Myxococcales bacterium]|nr:hypothetical protein [Myxococcales bacterium]